MSVRKLLPGQAVRIEVAGHIVKPLDDNPYWYFVSFDDGRPDELVSLARISAVNDRSRGVIDEDGSLQVFTPRLSALGGLDLLAWLRTHEEELKAAAGIAPECTAISTEVFCPSCHTSHDPGQYCAIYLDRDLLT